MTIVRPLCNILSMRHTNVRHLLRDFKEEIKNLPVTVTQLGQPIFKIVAVDEVETPSGFKPKEVTFVPRLVGEPVLVHEAMKGMVEGTAAHYKGPKEIKISEKNIAVVDDMVILSKGAGERAKEMEDIGLLKPLGWCERVVNNRRCGHQAVVETPKGKFCEEHK